MPIPFTKPALSYAAQLIQLEQRGLVVADRPAAEALLASVSYYRLSAYWHPLRRRDVTGELLDELHPGTSFDSVMALYEFDRRLRLLVLDALERVEVALRTAVTYQIGMTYGPFGHETAENFRRAVANPFHIHPKRLQEWLHVLTYVRNVCAHHSRLWNRELAIRTSAMPEPEWSPPLLPRQDRLFCVLLMLRFLMRQSGNGTAWRDACNELLVPVASDPRWQAAMGMANNWLGHPLWR